jgi:hypothetical protein
VATLADKLCFTIVPNLEDFMAGSAAKNARVDQTSEFDAWDVAGGAVDAFEVPDGFGSGKMLACTHKAMVALTYGFGYISSKKPPPFSLAKTPVKPQGWS